MIFCDEAARSPRRRCFMMPISERHDCRYDDFAIVLNMNTSSRLLTAAFRRAFAYLVYTLWPISSFASA
jgi:hypothetical protein